jgi:hypothetical protein
MTRAELREDLDQVQAELREELRHAVREVQQIDQGLDKVQRLAGIDPLSEGVHRECVRLVQLVRVRLDRVLERFDREAATLDRVLERGGRS